MSRRYAADTAVSVEKSKAEIERTLVRYGADQFAYGIDGTKAMIGFRAHERQVRLLLPLPDRTDQEFTHTPAQGYRRSADGAEKAWEQASRQSWRALALVIKAKLEAVEAGIATFEDEFLAYTVLPGGSTVGEQVAPAIEEAYTTGRVQPLLALGSGS